MINIFGMNLIIIGCTVKKKIIICFNTIKRENLNSEYYE